MKPHYDHTQVGWVIIVSLGFGGWLAAFAMLMSGLANVVWPVVGVLALALLVFGTLNVRVDADSLVARFGIGLIRKRIELSRVRACGAVENSWIYGWGIRFFPGGILYNVSGFDAVELRLDDGKKIRIGTDEPDALVAAIQESVGELEPLSAEERAEDRKKASHYIIVFVVVIAVVVALVGGLIWQQSKPIKVAVDGNGFTVETLFYGERFAMSEVTAVTLRDKLPTVEARTNGFAAGDALRGNFRLAELGEGKVFADAGSGPFVLVRLENSYVILNKESPEATRRLYEEIKHYSGGP